MERPLLKSLHHCFLDAEAIAINPLSSLVERSLFKLEDFNISIIDFACLPEFPADCMEAGMFLEPFTDIGRQEFDDADGKHSFRLMRLKGSIVSVCAAVPEPDTELFCKRWSEDNLYAPFQGWEGVPLDVARQKCHDMALERLRPFFTYFRTLCQKALAEGSEIYVLWERHERQMA